MIPLIASVLWIKFTLPFGFFMSLPIRLNIGFLSSPIRPPKRIIVEEILCFLINSSLNKSSFAETFSGDGQEDSS